jgi:putative inorganic carbon (HCO3(-)) transporter
VSGLTYQRTDTADADVPTASPSRRRAFIVAAIFIAASGAAYSGLAVGTGQKAAVVLPLAIGIALVLAALAMTHFAEFVFLMLVIRTGIDLAKLSGPTAGNVSTDASVSRGLDPSAILAVLFLFAAGLWLTAQYYQRGRLPGTPLRRGLAIFAAAVLFSVTGSERPASSLLEALRILAIILMFVVLEQMMTNRGAMKRFLLAAFLSMIFPILYTTVRFVVGAPATQVQGEFSRLTGPFTQSNTFGRYLMLMVVFGVALYPHLTRRLQIAMGILLASGSVYLLLTLTMTAILGATAGLLAVGLLQSKRVIVALVLAGLCALLMLPSLASRIDNMTQTDAAANIESGNSLEWRWEYWQEVLPLVNTNPVTGIGLNMTQYNTKAAKQPHSDVVRAFVEMGLLGLAAYVTLLVLFITTGVKAVRASMAGTFDRGVAVGYLGCAAAVVTASLTANIMSNVVTLWYFMTFAAAASVVGRHPVSRAERFDVQRALRT